MYAGSLPILVPELVNALRKDSVYLFLGAAFVTLGITSAALSGLHRKFNPSLFWLGLFAVLDGIRVWLASDSPMILAGQSLIFERAASALNYVVPVSRSHLQAYLHCA